MVLLELELLELELELLELELLELCDHALANIATLIPKCPIRDRGLPAKCHCRSAFGPNRHCDPNCHGLTNEPILAMHLGVGIRFRDCGLLGCPRLRFPLLCGYRKNSTARPPYGQSRGDWEV